MFNWFSGSIILSIQFNFLDQEISQSDSDLLFVFVSFLILEVQFYGQNLIFQIEVCNSILSLTLAANGWR